MKVGNEVLRQTANQYCVGNRPALRLLVFLAIREVPVPVPLC